MKYESNIGSAQSRKSFRDMIFVATGIGVTLLGLILVMSRQNYSQMRLRPDSNVPASYTKKKFKLSIREFEKIRPMMDREIKNLMKLYVRYSNDEPEYSDRVWREIVQKRLEFESGIGVDLSDQQKAAIRETRSRTEKRIIDCLIEDHVRYFGQLLELEDWEFNDMLDVFEIDSKSKFRSINGHLRKNELLHNEINRISDDTETELRKILTTERWNSYLKMTRSRELVG